MLISNFATRLNEAIKQKDIKPAEIVRRSESLYKEGKINKALTKPLLSNYLKGTYEAKQDNVYALSLILNFDEAWLRGYDVPMKNENQTTINTDFRYANHNGINTDGLDENDIEEINRFVEFIKNKKKNEGK